MVVGKVKENGDRMDHGQQQVAGKLRTKTIFSKSTSGCPEGTFGRRLLQ
jgi:hypothetical protein